MGRINRYRALLTAVAAMAAFSALTGTAAATTFTVNTTADGTVPNGCTTDPACSLRDAVTAANANPGPDAIAVPAGHYVLTLGPLQPNGATNNSLTIAGAGARTTSIDAGGASRVIQNATGPNSLTLDGVTITGGAAPAVGGTQPGDGGGILFQGTGTLTLTRVAVVGNTAPLGGGGIYSPFEAPGGIVNIDSSTIAGNSVAGGAGNGQGGGLAVFGVLTVTSSTISGNSVTTPGTAEGGGIAAAKDASDMTTTPRPITLVSTTVAGNTVAGATPAMSFGAGISGDNIGAGPFNTELVARNSIVAGNTASGSTLDCSLTNTTATDHNLSSDGTCGFNDAGSLRSTDPKLGPLQDNGGPTDTRELLAASPAINAATNSGCPGLDQRGTDRPQAGICDIGAFELVFRADLAITKTAAPEPVVAGGNVTYTITVTNNGPQPAAGVSVTDQLPAGATLRSTSLGAACGGTPLVCQLPDLAPGAQATFTVVMATAAPGTLVNTATVAGTYADPDPANNSASTTTTVRPRTADVQIHNVARPRTVRVGGRIVYTLTVRNSGPEAATKTKVSLQLSSGVRLLAVRGHSGCKRGRVVTCSVGKITQGGVLTLRVTVTPLRTGRLGASATVRAAEFDPRLSNNRSSATVRVAAQRRRRATPPRFTG
jgi:uncharacterized repeat protein (TIGR01451 family)/CSLREA domain-containing protein